MQSPTRSFKVFFPLKSIVLAQIVTTVGTGTFRCSLDWSEFAIILKSTVDVNAASDSVDFCVEWKTHCLVVFEIQKKIL